MKEAIDEQWYKLSNILTLDNNQNYDFWKSTYFDEYMMTSSNGNIFRVTGPLCEGFTGRRWIPLTKANGAELSCFLWSVPE